MKQAKPTGADYAVVFLFFQDLEATMGGGHDYSDICDCVCRHWPAVAVSWQRVVEAGRVCIDNACDPELPHLEFKPEIREQKKEAERLKAEVESLKEENSALWKVLQKLGATETCRHCKGDPFDSETNGICHVCEGQAFVLRREFWTEDVDPENSGNEPKA